MAPRKGTRVPTCSASPRGLFDRASRFLQTSSREQEGAVSDAIEVVVRDALELIGGRQLDGLCCDNSSKIITNVTLQLHSTFFLGCDPGDPEANEVSSSTKGNQATDDDTDGVTSVADATWPPAGILFASLEPQPVTIDHWARGWVVSRSTLAGDSSRSYLERSGTRDELSSIGSRSLCSTKSAPALSRVRGRSLYQSSRKRVRRSEGKKAVPFSLGPDPREDQGLPPTALPSRDARGVGAGNNGGGFTDGFGNIPGSHVGGIFDDGFVAWLEELEGREWTIDGAGELLIVDRPGLGGKNRPKRVISAFYKFRDVIGSAQDMGVPVGSENASRLGGSKGSDRQRKRAESSPLLLSKSRSLSSTASRRNSTRRSSRQHLSREAERFFALEPTLQPNLTNSVDQPGPGVSVCDGSLSRKGPSWPQDPNHMSRGEYRQRKRADDFGATAHSMGEEGDTGKSYLGFSVGTVQSAPELVGGLDKKLGENRGGGGGSATRDSRARNSGRTGRVGLNQVHRGDSFSTFDDVNPLKGATKMPSSSTSSPRREPIGDERDGYGDVRGDLSLFSTPVYYEDESLGEGPEAGSGYGHVGQGFQKQTGQLPKVKDKLRERLLAHERPQTHSSRDLRRVTARKQPHVSPKVKTNSPPCNSYGSRAEDGGDVGSSTRGAFSSFPPLSRSLSGCGMSGGGHDHSVD